MQRVILISLFFYSFLAAASDTVLKLYRPFDDSTSAATKQLQGRCDAQSRLIIREDAWRCHADGVVYDPCFAQVGPGRKNVVCPVSPWSTEKIQINLSSPLNNQEHVLLDMSRTFPWAIELVNGDHCQAVETTEQYDSMPIRYHCTSNNILLGRIQRCNPVWSMLEKTSQGVIAMELKNAWF